MGVDSRLDASTKSLPSVQPGLQYVDRTMHKPVKLACHSGASPSASSPTSPSDMNTRIRTRGELTETEAARQTDANYNAPAQDVPVLFIYPHSRIRTQAYPRDIWDAKKPVLHNLYMERCLSLQMVMQIMAQEWDFHPTYVHHPHRTLASTQTHCRQHENVQG
jgi:hypothetical protein